PLVRIEVPVVVRVVSLQGLAPAAGPQPLAILLDRRRLLRVQDAVLVGVVLGGEPGRDRLDPRLSVLPHRLPLGGLQEAIPVQVVLFERGPLDLSQGLSALGSRLGGRVRGRVLGTSGGHPEGAYEEWRRGGDE